MNTYLYALACSLLVLLPACGPKKKEAVKPAPPEISAKVVEQSTAPQAAQKSVETDLDQNEAPSYQNNKMEEELLQELNLK